METEFPRSGIFPPSGKPPLRLSPCKYFISRLAAAVYNGVLLRLCLPDALETCHKLELLKLEQNPAVLLKRNPFTGRN